MVRNYTSVRKGEQGQSFMELAISLVFLLILLSVVIELGWAFYTMTALRDTAQEAASYGAICPMVDATNDNKEGIKDRLIASSTAPLDPKTFNRDDIVVTYWDPTGATEQTTATRGDMVRVSVKYTHQIIVPFASTFLGTTTYPLSAEVSDTVLVDKCKAP